MKPTQRLILALILSLASACAHGPSKLDKALKNSLNHDISAVIAKAGPPSSQFKMPNGNVIYTWHQVGTSKTVASNNYFGPKEFTTTTKACDLSFTTNELGMIMSYRYQGNSCR